MLAIWLFLILAVKSCRDIFMSLYFGFVDLFTQDKFGVEFLG